MRRGAIAGRPAEPHLRKGEEYLGIGILAVWIVDTEKRVFYVQTPEGTKEHRSGLVTVPGTPIQLDVLQAFSTLDE